MSYADTNSQPAPVPSDKPAVWDLVLADMAERDRMGREKYGTPLQGFNGRDALVDAYQEALDLVVYLRTAIYERDNSVVKSELTTAMPEDFDQQNQLIGGAMIRCHDCIAEHCPCVSS